MRTYIFRVGQQHFEIEAKDEKKALIKLINEEWEYIQQYSKIYLDGEQIF